MEKATEVLRPSNRLLFESWVPFPLSRVFAFFSDPANLPRIMPPGMEIHIDRLISMPPSPSSEASAPSAAGVGTAIETSFRLVPFLPVRARWISRITEFELNHHFADVQEKGLFKRWHHRHEFKQEIRSGVSGVLVRDLIEYEVGFGPLGWIADRVFVEREMRRTFEHRQKMLPQLLG